MKRVVFGLSIVLASASTFGMVTANPEYNSQKKGKAPLKALKESRSLSNVSVLYETNDNPEAIGISQKKESRDDTSVFDGSVNDSELSNLFYLLKELDRKSKKLDKEKAELLKEIEYLSKELAQMGIKEENCTQSSAQFQYYQNCENTYTSDPYQPDDSNNFSNNSQSSMSCDNPWLPNLSIINPNCLNRSLFKR